MANLVYYKEERETFSNAYKKELTWKEAEIVVKKLARHFGLGKIFVEWTSGGRHPKAFGTWKILLNYDYNNFGVICHELAHTRCAIKYHKMGHNKRHKRFMKGMARYCEKKDWFENELKRRTEVKVRPEPTKEEIRLQKIKRLEHNIKKHQTKIKRCTTLIKKANRRISALKRFS